ncbi:MAG TPA: hypothetical protein GX700_16720 [Paracoccus sp.]|nr:hypothetical protein [Paracoccus sp. (in: a-proteobacteria)]
MAELSTLGSVIKTAYEGQTNTNAFTDALQTKLSGIEAGAEVNTVSPGDIPTAPADIGAATAAQGALAASAVQPGDIGTAAAEDVGAFATAAQGALADTALQSVPAGVAVPDAVAAPTMEEFNALLASLRGAGLIAT